MPDKKIEEVVEQVLKDEHLSNYKIAILGKTTNAEGRLGNIFFVTVSGTTKEGKSKTLDLVIKTSKESKALRQQTPIKQTFEKEIFIYSRVLKIFDDLQQEMGVRGLLNFFPHCYATEISNDSEMLAFENVKNLGYSMWDRMIPMTQRHMRLILEAYGQFHAFSLALRKTKRDVFEELTKDNRNMFSEFFVKVNMVDFIVGFFEETKEACVAENEEELLDKLKNFKNDGLYILTDLFSEDPDYRVISHGDCWANNFMFKSETDPSEPESVFILDWQCSGLSSPVMDLSHVIYACCDTEIHTEVSEFLKLYYNSLRKSLELLGCDANEVFPYSKLVEHWKRFSKYGLLIQPFVLKFATCDSQEAPDLAEAAEQGIDFLENFNFEINNKEEFYRRVKANLVHYVKNLEISEEY